MAEVFKRAKGMKVEKVVALHERPQNWIDTEANRIGNRAKRNLAQHRHEGHAYIEVTKGDVDRWVTLNDERGQSAAMSIEFGRNATMNDEGELSGGMRGLAVLRRAAGIYGEAP